LETKGEDVTDPVLNDEAPQTADQPDFGTDVDAELVASVHAALEAGDVDRLRGRVEPLHDADIADLLQNLSADDRRRFVEMLRSEFHPAVLAELDEHVRSEIIDELGVKELAQAVAELETDDALHVLANLDEREQQQLLDAIPPEDRVVLEQGLAYREFSAGRLMRREMVAVPTFWTVGETIDFLRSEAEDEESGLPDEFHDIFVVDPAFRPIGIISLSRLLRTRRPVTVTDIMAPDMKLVRTDADQEDVAFLFRQRDLISAPVVDESGRLVGMITIDDVVDVIDEEYEDVIMRLGGVPGDDLYRAVVDTVRSRSPWLLLNLGTAILASLVIGLFEDTIAQLVALAVLMPIVASMGGNAGTQTLTVAVRALATRELTPANAMRVIRKEAWVGTINGLLFAVVASGVAWVWFGNVMIAVVIGLAMIVNLIAAAVFGALIPLALERLRIDPAVSSGVFLTTVTDVVGFFAFLGLAAWMIL
jgi:magnesium transporter